MLLMEGEMMTKESVEFKSIKRKAYLIILPVILFSAVLTFFIRISNEQYGFDLYMNALLAMVFIVSWLAFYMNYEERFFECLNLVLLLTYYWFSVLFTTQGQAINEAFIGNNWFIVWLPLFIFYIFAVFTRSKAIGVSIALWLMSILPAIYYWNELNDIYIESLIQLYIATIIYIILVIYVFKLFEAYMDSMFMRQQFYLDPLTQIGNRYQINKWMAASLAKVERIPFSLIFFDVDRFKDINDQFGHVIGDKVLQELVSVIQKKIDGHHFGRWGGEEFMIFTQTPECDAFAFAEELRDTLAQHHFNEVGQVTASFGVTSCKEGDTVESILQRVDTKLYESKRKGRNRVTGKF